MNRSLHAAVSCAALALLAGCISDPTATLRNEAPSQLVISKKYMTLNVGDSARLTAQAVDNQGNLLSDAVTFTALNAATVDVATAAAPPALSRSDAYVKPKAFGTGKIEVSVGSIRDTVTVATLPARARITGQTDTLLGSGNSMQLSAQALSATGAVITGVTPITWSTSNASIATVDATGLVTGQATGTVDVILTVPGATTRIGLTVVPGVFGGTLSASAGIPGDIITVTKAASGPVFDADTRAFVKGVRTFIQNLTANSIEVVIPPIGQTGAVDLLIDNMGAAQVAQKVTFTSNSATLNDQTEPNDDPSTSPVISTNGDRYITFHGGCDEGVAVSGSDDCDDFFTVTNSTGSPLTVTVQLQWYTAADADIYVCNAACNAFLKDPADANPYEGAGSSNPEVNTYTIPAGVTVRYYFNLYEPGGTVDLMRVRVSGLP